MNIEVLIFGPAAMNARTNHVRVSVGDHPTVREIIAALLEQHPVLTFALSAPRLAVNHVLATPDTIVRAGDEVALIALVGGG